MINTFKRCEKKFIISSRQFEKLMPRLEEYTKKDEYCTKEGCYKIYNVYYDTPDSSVIRRSLSKPYYKEKLRMRSYSVPENDTDRVFLELKKKIGGTVNKRRAVLTLGDALDFVQKGIKPEANDYITRQVLNEIDYFLKINPVRPAAYIAYTRTALFGKKNPDLRITFDSRITTRRTDVSLMSGCYGSQLLGQDQYLMEVKFSGSMDTRTAKILSELKIYPTSFSKYGTEYKQYCMSRTEKTAANF
ncbi:MAG: polyphosphate polymerase domain-containing protein [Oscillospiraceae bacterium]|nr:polyphosphate polymerase domain-containing protein [Oscillospiraceae bacterium]